MKKIISCLLVLTMMLALVSVFSACGGEEKGTENESESKTEKITEKTDESESESESESATGTETESDSESESDKEKLPPLEIIGEPVVLPENTRICKMEYNNLYVEKKVPAFASSIVDAWPSYKEGYDRGLTFRMAEEDVGDFTKCVYESGNGAKWEVNSGSEVYIANPEKCYIYNGTPGDEDFGARLNTTIKDLFDGCIGSALTTEGPYIWVGNIWAFHEEQCIPDGYYTFVLYGEDGSTFAFTEWVVPSFYEDTYKYSFKEYEGKKTSDDEKETEKESEIETQLEAEPA